MSKNKNDVTKYRVIVGVILALCLAGLLVVGLYSSSKPSEPAYHKPIAKLEKQHKVTKALNKTDAVLYAGNSDLAYQETITALNTGSIKRIILLMYSDGCPLCNSHINDLVKFVNTHATNQIAVIAVNDGRDNDAIGENFDVPSTYHYPAVFTYLDQHTTSKLDSPFRLQSKQELYR